MRSRKDRLRQFLSQPENLLLGMALVMPMTFSVWQALLNNFTIEVAMFTGREIGLLQSLREVPGFLAFLAVYILLFINEQRFALVSLCLLSLGVAVTGWFPFEYGLYATTILMSVGFHYYETINQSLTLQWLPKDRSAHFLGKAKAVSSASALIAFGSIWLLMGQLDISYNQMYMLAGFTGLLLTLAMWFAFPRFEQPHVQHKHFLLRRRYWLYYFLTCLSGARRQIFVVFAGFLMVEKFGFSVAEISSLFLLNYVFNMLFAARIGAWIGRVGERTALTVEYLGLILVFAGYAFVEHAWVAAGLYIVDHLFFSLSIAIKTYLQKIADPKDMAATASVSFSINHIAAVVIPAMLGLLWLSSPSLVFLIGVALATASLVISQLIPDIPKEGQELRWQRVN